MSDGMAEDIIAVTREEFVRAVETLGLPSASATYLDTMAAVFGVRRDAAAVLSWMIRRGRAG